MTEALLDGVEVRLGVDYNEQRDEEDKVILAGGWQSINITIWMM